MLIATDNIEFKGLNFRVETFADDDSAAPWDREDGHGAVSEWTRRAKRPGERVLSGERRDGSHRFYDFAGAMVTAKAEGWDAKPYGGTKGEKAARAVEADFQRLRGWCNDDWHYVGIRVTMVDVDGIPMTGSADLWGMESDCDGYLNETAEELAENLISETLAAL